MPARRSGAPTFCPAATRARTSCPARRRSPTSTAASPPAELQQLELELIAEANRTPPGRHGRGDAALEARIRSFETAFGMQRRAPEAFDLSGETDADTPPLRPEARAARPASAGSAWSPAGWPSAASASSN